MKWRDKKEELEKMINDGISYEEIGRKFGCSGSNIKKVAIRLGIILYPRRKINEKEHFNRGNGEIRICENCGREYFKYQEHRGKFCSHECYSEYQKKKTISDWKNGKSSGCDSRFKLAQTIREYILKSKNYECERCGFSGFNPYTGKSILNIHHIDGDASNTTEENLQVLCPNCHAMTENFGSRNNSSVRKYRREEYKKYEDKIKMPD